MNIGRGDGVWVGMRLFVIEPRHVIEAVRVTNAEESRSEAIMIQLGEDEPHPEVGWRLSDGRRQLEPASDQ